MQRMEPSVKLVAIWMAQVDWIKRRPFDREGARAFSLAHWPEFTERAATFIACKRALREQDAAPNN